jgi:hypothetical protein
MYGFQTAIVGALAVLATTAAYRFNAREADPSAYDFTELEARNVDPYSYLSGRSLEAREEESFRRRYLAARTNGGQDASSSNEKNLPDLPASSKRKTIPKVRLAIYLSFLLFLTVVPYAFPMPSH